MLPIIVNNTLKKILYLPTVYLIIKTYLHKDNHVKEYKNI